MPQKLERKIRQKRISSGKDYVVGLKYDGTVLTNGKNENGQCNVSDWKDIISISAGRHHTVGLTDNLTVVATGLNDDGQCNVSGWENIIDIDAGSEYTVGLRADGTVVATGNNRNGECDVSEWEDIVAISAGDMHTVGLKSDGTVVATGDCSQGKLDVDEWNDIVYIDACGTVTLGVKEDGTVLATERSEVVRPWRNIISVSGGWLLGMVGLQADGKIACDETRSTAKEYVPYWTDVVEVHSNWNYLALCTDGRVLTIGIQSVRDRLKSWKLLLTDQEKNQLYDEATDNMNSGSENSYKLAYDKFKSLKGYKDSDSLKKKCQEEYVRLKIERLEKEERALTSELEHISGFFAGKKRKNIEKRLEEIKHELQQ